MPEKLKVADKDALEKVKGCMDKLLNQPVSKRVGEMLKKRGDLERQHKEEQNERSDEACKATEVDVLKKINARTKKLLNQPVSKRIGSLLAEAGRLERELKEK